MATTKRPRPGIVLDEFTSETWPRYSPQCSFCRHWHAGGGRVCDAFNARTPTKTIPADVWAGRVHHDRDLPGQAPGVHLELAPGAEAGARKAGLIE